MNPRLLLPIVLVLILGVMFFAWGNGTFATPVTTPEKGRSEQPISARGDQASDLQGAGVQRAELTDLPSPPAAGKRIRLQAVTSAGAPVVGATVHYWPAGETDHRERWRLVKMYGRDMEAALHAHGRELVTGEGGFVEFVAAVESDVCARLGDDYGQLDLYGYADPHAEAVRIVLMNDVTLEVDVVQTDGRPVVGRAIHVYGTLLARMSGITSVGEMFGPSDSAGKVVVPHLLFAVDALGELLDGDLQVHSRRQENDTHRPTTIASQAVHHTALRGVVKVRLVEPVGGLIEVRVVDADNEPMQVLVTLQAEDGEGWMMGGPMRGAVSLFAGVPLDRRWRAVTKWSGKDHFLEIVGPRASGQLVAVNLPMPVRQWHFTGRFVRADGSPIVKQSVELQPVAPHPFLNWYDGRSRTVKTDGLGRASFSLWLPSSVRSLPGFTIEMTVRGLVSPDFRIERTLTIAEGDVGDLVNPQAGEDELLAEITFSCEGKPLKDAWVAMQQGKRDGGRASNVSFRKVRRGPVLELWGLQPGEGPLAVVCKHFDCLNKSINVPPGGHVSVELERSASLVLRLNCGDLPFEDLSAMLIPLGEANHQYGQYLDFDQQVCEWGDVPPGRYRLRIEAHEVVLHEVAEIVLQKGHNTWPASGERLDLGSLVDGIYLLARAETIREPVEVEAMLVPRASLTLPEDVELVGAWFPRPDAGTDLLVRAGGFVPVRIATPTKDLFLELRLLTTLHLKQSETAYDEVRGRLLFDPIVDPLLRAFDDSRVHDTEFEFEEWNDAFEQEFVPGTKLELTPFRNGVAGTPIEVVIGDDAHQQLQM